MLYSFLPTICARKKIIINSWIRKPRRYIDDVALTTRTLCSFVVMCTLDIEMIVNMSNIKIGIFLLINGGYDFIYGNK